MCIRELFREFVAAKRRAVRDRERDICLAWNTAALTGAAWAGKMPKLETLLEKTQSPKRQDVKTQRVMLEALAKTYKLPLRKVERPKQKTAGNAKK